MNSKASLAKVALTDFKEKIDPILKAILDAEILEAKNYTSFAVDYMKELMNITAVGGKRLRPSFVYYTYQLCGGKNIESIMQIAAAIELIHVFLLIEDDFMDLAVRRHGYPTINETYRKLHQTNKFKKESTHFGHSIAVNVGIIADHIASNIILNSDFDLGLVKRALNQLNMQIITTGHGQIHDVLNEVRRELTQEDIINVLYWKTGIYTYNNPIQVGAILAGADDAQLKMLAEYAIPGGVAFQIQDDILGTFGNESVTGKSNDGDIIEGKQTLLTFYANQNGNAEQREILNKVVGKPDATESEVDEVRKIFVETGALELTKKKALSFVKEAKSALLKHKDVAGWHQDGVDYLEGIADYMIEREF